MEALLKLVEHEGAGRSIDEVGDRYVYTTGTCLANSMINRVLPFMVGAIFIEV